MGLTADDGEIAKWSFQLESPFIHPSIHPFVRLSVRPSFLSINHFVAIIRWPSGSSSLSKFEFGQRERLAKGSRGSRLKASSKGFFKICLP